MGIENQKINILLFGNIIHQDVFKKKFFFLTYYKNPTYAKMKIGVKSFGNLSSL